MLYCTVLYCIILSTIFFFTAFHCITLRNLIVILSYYIVFFCPQIFVFHAIALRFVFVLVLPGAVFCCVVLNKVFVLDINISIYLLHRYTIYKYSGHS